ncbi:hypothetical protein F4808DRAFT_357544 [Astrocystis sublimbata]|nr:hypothetical protein F4808DRAFT_357544 [Astrocystis sublimbata]
MGDLVWQSASLSSAAAPLLGCTDISFSSPGWFVQNFAHEGKHVEFYLSNFVDERWKVFCSGDVGGAQNRNTCNAQDELHDQLGPTSFDFDLQTNELMINQTWYCLDRTPEPFLFTAVGDVVVQAQADSQRIPVSLVAPVHITPLMPAPPVGMDSRNCRERSDSKPPLNLRDLSFEQWDSDWSIIFGFVHLEYLNFNLTNQVIDLTENCRNGYTNMDFSDRPHSGWYNCTVDTTRDIYQEYNDGRYEIYTYLDYDKEAQKLAINQTWYCDDPQQPSRYIAHGAIELSETKCDDEVYEGDYHINTCYFEDAEMTTYELEKDVLPPDTLHRPEPVQHSCTVSSFVDNFMEIREFRLPAANYQNNGATTAEIDFQTFNPTFVDHTFNAYGGDWSLLLDEQGSTPDGAWTNCRLMGSSDDVSCKMSFDRSSSVLRLNQSWPCSDKDPSHGIRFDASFVAKLPLRDCICPDEYCPENLPGAICIILEHPVNMTLADFSWTR